MSPIDQYKKSGQIVYVYTPTNFWLRLEDRLQEYSQLVVELLSDYVPAQNDPRYMAKNIAVGSLYCAYNKELNEWHRVKVTRICGNCQFDVLYIDIGKTATLPGSGIKTLKSKYQSQPDFGVHCSLHNIQPVNGEEWPKPAIDYFTTLVNSKILTFQINEYPEHGVSDLHVIDINIKSLNVAQELVKYGHAANRQPPSEVEIKPINSSPFDYILQSNNIKELETSDVYVPAIVSPFHFYTQQIPVYEDFDKIEKQLQDFYNKPESYLTSKLKNPSIGTLCVAIYKEDRKWYRAVIKEVNKAKNDTYDVFYIDYGNEDTVGGSDLRKIADSFARYPAVAVKCSLRKIKENANTQIQETACNSMMCNLLNDRVKCRYHSKIGDTWYIDIKLNNKELLANHLINAGHVDAFVEPKPVTPPPSKVQTTTQQPKRQSPVTMATTTTATPVPQSQQVKPQAQLQTASFVSKSQQQPSNVCVKPAPLIMTQPSFSGTYAHPASLNKDDLFEVLITNVDTINEFSMQLVKYRQELYGLNQDLESFYRSNTTTPLKLYDLNTPCVYLDDEKKSWYRGLIIQSIPNSYSVIKLVDYGIVKCVHRTLLKQLNEKFYQPCPQAVSACLVDMSMDANIDDHNLKFKEVALNKIFICKIVDVVKQEEPNENKYAVSLLSKGHDVLKDIITATPMVPVVPQPVAQTVVQTQRSKVSRMKMDEVLTASALATATSDDLENIDDSPFPVFDQPAPLPPNAVSQPQRYKQPLSSNTNYTNIERPNNRRNSHEPSQTQNGTGDGDSKFSRIFYSPGIDLNKRKFNTMDRNNGLEKAQFSKFQPIQPQQRVEGQYQEEEPHEVQVKAPTPEAEERDKSPAEQNDTVSTDVFTQPELPAETEVQPKPVTQIAAEEPPKQPVVLKSNTPSPDSEVQKIHEERNQSHLAPLRIEVPIPQATAAAPKPKDTVQFDSVDRLHEQYISLFKSHPVCITSFYNVNNFFVQLQDDFYKFDQGFNELQAVCDTAPKLEIIKVGQVCAVRYTEDDAWYRAEIISLNQAEQTADVRFVDYGNVQTSTFTELVQLSRTFSQAKCTVQASLAYINPNKQLTDNELLKLENIAYYAKEDDSDKHEWRGIFVETHGQNEYTIHIDALLCKAFNAGLVDIVEPKRGVDVPKQFDASVLKLENLMFDSKICTIKNLKEIYLQLSFTTDEFNFLLKKLDDLQQTRELIRLDRVVKDVNRIGFYCLCLHVNTVHRGLIKAQSNEVYTVNLIDYGNDVTVNNENVYYMYPHFYKIKKQAIQLRLPYATSIEAVWNEAEKKQFYDCFHANKIVDIKLISTFEPFIFEFIGRQDISFDFKPILERLKVKSEHRIEQHCAPVSYMHTYQICYAKDFKNIYLHSRHLANSLNRLHKNLNNDGEMFSSLNKLKSPIQVGLFYLVKCERTQNWYRAKILESNATSYHVYYIDYGFDEYVALTDKDKRIRNLMHNEFRVLPAFAYHCQLANIDTLIEHLRPYCNFIDQSVAFSLFDSYRKTNKTKFTVKFVNDTIPYEIELYDQRTSMGLDEVLLNYIKSNKSQLKLTGFITDLTDTNDFYMQNVTNSDYLATLQPQIDASAQALTQYKKDTLCVAVYNADSAMYRARIVEHLPSVNKVKVFYIDFGNYDEVNTAEVTQLPDELARIPPLALHCRIYGFDEDKVLSDEFKAYITAYGIDDNLYETELHDYVTANNGAAYYVQLIEQKTKKSIQDLFIEHTKHKNVAVKLWDNYKQNKKYQTFDFVEYDVDGGNDEDCAIAEQIDVTLVDGSLNLTVLDEDNYAFDTWIDTPSILIEYRQRNNNLRDMTNATGFNDTSRFDATNVTINQTQPVNRTNVEQSVLVLRDSQNIANDSNLAYSTACDDGDSVVFACANETTVKLDDTENQQEKTVEIDESGAGDWIRQEEAIIKSKTVELLPNKIVESVEEPEVPVEPEEEVEEDESTRPLITDKSMIYNVHDLQRPPITQHARVGEESVVFVENEPNTVQEGLSASTVDVYLHRDVVVSTLTSFDSFYIQLVGFESDIEKIQPLIDTCLNEIESHQPGTLCVAQFSVDYKFYRAKMIEYSEAKSRVLFIDFGNEDLSDTLQITGMSEELKKIAPLAVHCALDIKHKTPEAFEKFKQLTDDVVPLNLKLVEKLEDGRLLVQLFNADDDTPLSQFLNGDIEGDGEEEPQQQQQPKPDEKPDMDGASDQNNNNKTQDSANDGRFGDTPSDNTWSSNTGDSIAELGDYQVDENEHDSTSFQYQFEESMWTGTPDIPIEERTQYQFHEDSVWTMAKEDDHTRTEYQFEESMWTVAHDKTNRTQHPFGNESLWTAHNSSHGGPQKKPEQTLNQTKFSETSVIQQTQLQNGLNGDVDASRWTSDLNMSVYDLKESQERLKHQIEYKETYEGIVTVVNSLGSFFVQIHNADSELMNMKDKIDACRDKLDVKLDQIQLNGLCIAINELYGNERQRARIITKHADSKFTVLFIDYGMMADVPFESLFRMNPDLKKIEPLALHCCLKDILINKEIAYSSDNIDNFKIITSKKEVTVKILQARGTQLPQVGTYSMPYVVDLYIDDMNIIHYLRIAPTSVSKAIGLNKPVTNSNGKLFNETSSHYIGMVTHINSINSFYVQRLSSIKLINKLLNELNNMTTTCVDIDENEEYFLAPSPEYYTQRGCMAPCMRVRIIKTIDENNLQIEYIDYGFKGQIEKSKLFPLPKNLSNIPWACEHYKLHLVSDYDCQSHTTQTRINQLFRQLLNLHGPLLNARYRVSLSTKHSNDVTQVDQLASKAIRLYDLNIRNGVYEMDLNCLIETSIFIIQQPFTGNLVALDVHFNYFDCRHTAYTKRVFSEYEKLYWKLVDNETAMSKMTAALEQSDFCFFICNKGNANLNETRVNNKDDLLKTQNIYRVVVIEAPQQQQSGQIYKCFNLDTAEVCNIPKCNLIKSKDSLFDSLPFFCLRARLEHEQYADKSVRKTLSDAKFYRNIVKMTIMDAKSCVNNIVRVLHADSSNKQQTRNNKENVNENVVNMNFFQQTPIFYVLSSIRSFNQFYIQTSQTPTNINLIQNRLTFALGSLVTPENMRPNEIYIIKSAKRSGMMCRAQIIQQKPDQNQCEVFLIDYGNIETVNLKTDLYTIIDTVIRQLQPQAIYCKLDVLCQFEHEPEELQRKLLAYFFTLTSNKPLDVNFDDKTKNIVELFIRATGESVNTRLLEYYNSLKVDDSVATNDTLKVDLILNAFYTNIEITSVININEFYCRFTNWQVESLKIQNAILSDFKNGHLKPLRDYKTKSYCLVVADPDIDDGKTSVNDDKVGLRAQILSLDEANAQVYLIDMGTFNYIPKSCIYEFNKKYYIYPMICFKCELAYLQCVNIEACRCTFETYLDLNERNLKFKFLKYNPDSQSYATEIWDLEKDVNNLNTLLVNKKHAKYIVPIKQHDSSNSSSNGSSSPAIYDTSTASSQVNNEKQRHDVQQIMTSLTSVKQIAQATEQRGQLHCGGENLSLNVSSASTVLLNISDHVPLNKFKPIQQQQKQAQTTIRSPSIVHNQTPYTCRSLNLGDTLVSTSISENFKQNFMINMDISQMSEHYKHQQHRTQFPDTKLTAHLACTVYLVNLNSPKNFSIVLSEDKDRRLEYLNNLHKFYKRATQKNASTTAVRLFESYKIGMACCVYSLQISKYCRGVIIKCEKDYCRVYLIDYGEMLNVQAIHIYELNEEFLYEKRYAHRCQLVDEGQYDIESLKSITHLLNKFEFKMVIKKVEKIPLIPHYDDAEHMYFYQYSVKIIEKNLPKHLFNDYFANKDLSENDSLSAVDRILCSTYNSESSRGNDFSNEELSSFVSSRPIRDYSAIVENTIKNDDDNDDGDDETMVDAVQTMKKEIFDETNGLMTRLNDIQQGERIRVRILPNTFISTEFICQKLDYLSEYRQLESDLNFFYEHNSSLINKNSFKYLSVGDLCAAKFGNGWCRCRIIDIAPSSSIALIECIDDARSQRLSIDRLHGLLDEFKQRLMPFAFKCKLFGLDRETASQMLNQSVMNKIQMYIQDVSKEFIAEIMVPHEDDGHRFYEVNVYMDKMNILDVLKKPQFSL